MLRNIQNKKMTIRKLKKFRAEQGGFCPLILANEILLNSGLRKGLKMFVTYRNGKLTIKSRKNEY
jgi:hypothetical protein